MTNRVLIIDDDREIDDALRSSLNAAGLQVDAVTDGFSAIQHLRDEKYCAVILDPMIRQRLNGFVVLDFIEQQQPETLKLLFLLTGMSEQTIARTAPNIASRLFRKPVDAPEVVAAILLLTGLVEKPRVRRKVVLLVEDDLSTASLMRQIVEELGYEVTLAHTGRKALEHIATSDFSAVMLDLLLPDLDGFSVLEHLRKKKSAALRHLIVTTGMPDRYMDPIDRDGICAVMQKPIDPIELSRMLQHCEQRGAE